MLFPPAQQFFFITRLIDGCLKYKNKEKPKTGPRPGPRLNYDGRKKVGARAEMQGSTLFYVEKQKFQSFYLVEGLKYFYKFT